jgi:uncharacterized protein (DUF433 family)
MMSANQYVDVRNGGYYVTGTRVGLDIVIHEYRGGRTAEDIFDAHPAVGSLAKVFGSIAFILEHPAKVEAYLTDQDRIFEEIKTQYPMSQEMIERFEPSRKEAKPRVA